MKIHHLHLTFDFTAPWRSNTFGDLAEIPGFLSEDECRVVVQLAQLKGLMESQLMVQDGHEELTKELNLSPEEIFELLDINQDGQLQLHEVTLWVVVSL